MRRRLSVGVVALGLAFLGLALPGASGAAGQTCFNTLELTCPEAVSPSMVYVDVMVTNCTSTIDAFGFMIECRWDRLLFHHAETANTLVENWIEADAAIYQWVGWVRVGGYDLAGIAPGTSGTLIRLYFEIVSWMSLDTALWFLDWSLTDDVVGFALYGCDGGGDIPVRGRTWGAVKALYE